MKGFEQEVGRAIRVEYNETTDRVCVVFEITHPKTKQEIKTTWVNDIEFQIIDKKLITKEEK